jgi:uncharacterized protein
MKLTIAGSILATLLFVALLYSAEPLPTYSLGTIERADTNALRTQGLSGREEIPEDYGMLFLFPEKGRYGFWMKDMQVPIDIFWLSDDGTIIAVNESVSPDTYPLAFYPPEPVRYVLETKAGTASMRNWTIGTTLVLPIP